MKYRHKIVLLGSLGLLFYVGIQRGIVSAANQESHRFDDVISANARRMLQEGRKIFRYDTFGDEAFWGDTIKLHQALAGEKNGGVGPGVSRKTALSVGLKVDVDALPPAVVDALKANKVNLDDPATTMTLLKANSVVGVTGHFKGGKLISMGVQCALCH